MIQTIRTYKVRIFYLLYNSVYLILNYLFDSLMLFDISPREKYITNLYTSLFNTMKCVDFRNNRSR